MKLIKKIDAIYNKIEKIEKDSKKIKPTQYQPITHILFNLIFRGIFLFIFTTLFLQLFANFANIFETLQKTIYKLTFSLIGGHVGDIFILQIVNICFLFIIIIFFLFIISIFTFIFGGDFNFFIKSTKKLLFILLITILFITFYHTFITGEIYSVDSENLKFNAFQGLDGFLNIFKKIGCYMDANCIINEKQRDNSNTIKEGDYKVSIEFPNYFNNRINWEKDDNIDISFTIKVKADGSYPLILKSYSCNFGTKNKLLGTSIYSKNLELIQTKKLNKNITTKQEEFLISANCLIPAEKIKGNSEIEDYILNIELDINTKTSCQYPFYILKFENILEKYGIEKKEEKNKEMIIYSLLNNKILTKEFGTTQSKFLCSNNIFNINYPKLQQPFFAGTNLDYYQNIFFDINIKQDDLNKIGKSISGHIYNVKLPKSLTLNTDKTKDIIKNGESFTLKNPKFYDDKLSFALFFNNLENIEKRKTIEYLEFFLQGNFKHTTNKNILIRNLDYNKNTNEETPNNNKDDNNDNNNNNENSQENTNPSTNQNPTNREELEKFCNKHKTSQENINCTQAPSDDLINFYKQKTKQK